MEDITGGKGAIFNGKGERGENFFFFIVFRGEREKLKI